MVEWCDDDYIDELKDKVESLESRNAAVVAMLRELQTCIPDLFDRPSVCPVCWQHRQNGHAPDCRLVALIREGEG